MRLVVKIGSNILTGDTGALNHRRIASVAAAVAQLHRMGHEVIMVSSGAIAAGMKKMSMKRRPVEVELKQATAAVGQPELMWAYAQSFKEHKITVAQVLLTREGLSDRTMYINSRNTLTALLRRGIVPIVNENDTVATDEIRFGDNDQLAFLVAAQSGAERLVILSDVQGLFDCDPKKHANARLIDRVERITDETMAMTGGAINSGYGTGGMYSKLIAAKKAMASGITVNIINGNRPSLLVSVVKGNAHGTEFKAKKTRITARKSWIAHGIRMKGSLTLDAGAQKAISKRGTSLLPSGITGVDGKFQRGDAVYCIDIEGNRIAKGLINYSSEETQKIMGLKTARIEKTLGYRYSDEVIHRDNMVLL